MAPSVYETADLKACRSHIRVLELHPGQLGDSLEGSLSIHSLDDAKALPYTALSYSWGLRTSEDTTIQLQQKTQPVAVWANLKHALNALRRTDRPVTLWVDAICINQADDEDKHCQVPLMDQIYSNALKTVIWLGTATDNSARGMQCIQIVSNKTALLRTPPPISWLEDHLCQDDWVSIASIMRRDWWSRIWVIQEALKSRVTEVWCGNDMASLHDFAALELLRHSSGRDIVGMRQIPPYPFGVILSAWDLNVRDANSGICPLFDWIIITQRFSFTETKDRFYALLGLSSIEARDAIKIEYGARVSDDLLNIKATEHFLLQQKRLLPLQSGWKKNRQLPSWCPDWYTEQDGCVALVFSHTAGDGTPLLQFQACGPNHKTVTPRFLRSDQPRIDGTLENWRLCVSGWLFDSIDFFDPFAQFDLTKETTPRKQAEGRKLRRQALYDKCSAWQRIITERIRCKRPNPYGSPEALQSAFWRTLIADRDEKWKGPPPNDFGSRLAEFLDRGDVGPKCMSFLVPAVSRLAKRAFIITSQGRLGLASERCKRGDLICVLIGGDVPFVLRENEECSEGGHKCTPRPVCEESLRMKCEWVGESYIHGVMQGEVISGLERDQALESRKINFEIS